MALRTILKVTPSVLTFGMAFCSEFVDHMYTEDVRKIREMKIKQQLKRYLTSSVLLAACTLAQIYHTDKIRAFNITLVALIFELKNSITTDQRFRWLTPFLIGFLTFVNW